MKRKPPKRRKHKPSDRLSPARRELTERLLLYAWLMVTAPHRAEEVMK